MLSKPSQPALPILQQIKIEAPCPKDWEQMEGTDARRFCDHCQMQVHNFSELHPEEIQAVMISGERVCARMTRRSDGSLVTKSTQTVDQPMTRRGWLEKLSTVATAAMGILMIGCGKPAANHSVGKKSTNNPNQNKQSSNPDFPAGNQALREDAKVLTGDVALPDETIMGGAAGPPPEWIEEAKVGRIQAPIKKLGKVAPVSDPDRTD